jgi:hypothetical protein
MLPAVADQETRRSLARLPLFQGLPEAALIRLAIAARPFRLAAGAPLFRRGDPGEGLVIVLDVYRTRLPGHAGAF